MNSTAGFKSKGKKKEGEETRAATLKSDASRLATAPKTTREDRLDGERTKSLVGLTSVSDRGRLTGRLRGKAKPAGTQGN